MHRRCRGSAFIWASAACLVASVCSCGEPGERPVALGEVIVDALGDTITLERPPERVVSLAPNLTEIIYAIGEQDRLVGVTEFCDYPPEASEKPRVAGFNIMNLEAVVATNPGLIVSNRGNEPQDLEALRRMGIPVFTFRIDSLPALADAAEALGALLGASHAADSAAASWRSRVGSIERRVALVPPSARPRVFFGGTDEPIYSVGPGSYIHDVIIRAGGRNVFEDIGTSWPRVDLETLVARDPDVLVISYMIGAPEREAIVERLRELPGWRSLRAVRGGRVVTVGDEIMRPGPRLIGVLEQLNAEIQQEGR